MSPINVSVEVETSVNDIGLGLSLKYMHSLLVEMSLSKMMNFDPIHLKPSVVMLLSVCRLI